MSVFLQITTYDTPDYPLMSLIAPANWSRLEQQENSLSCIPIGVILPADLMDDVMAEGHIPECSGLARWPKLLFVVLQKFLDLLGNEQMVRVRLAIYQIRPIQVAPRSPLPLATEPNTTRLVSSDVYLPIPADKSSSSSSRVLDAASRAVGKGACWRSSETFAIVRSAPVSGLIVATFIHILS